MKSILSFLILAISTQVFGQPNPLKKAILDGHYAGPCINDLYSADSPMKGFSVEVKIQGDHIKRISRTFADEKCTTLVRVRLTEGRILNSYLQRGSPDVPVPLKVKFHQSQVARHRAYPEHLLGTLLMPDGSFSNVQAVQLSKDDTLPELVQLSKSIAPVYFYEAMADADILKDLQGLVSKSSDSILVGENPTPLIRKTP